MSLQEEIEDTKKKIAEALAEEENQPEEEAEEEAEEEKSEEIPEPEKEEPKEEKLDDAGYARLRRENAALKKQLEQKKPVERPIEENPVELPPILAKLVERENMMEAGKEFNQLEDNFRKIAPDYDDISNAYKMELYRANKTKNPRMGHDQLLETTNKELLYKASQYLNAGYDPIEEMYEEAKSLGIKPLPKQESEEEEEEKLKPNLKKVAENRSRNAGTAGAKGNAGQPEVTKAMAGSMTTAEYMQLPKVLRDKFMRG